MVYVAAMIPIIGIKSEALCGVVGTEALCGCTEALCGIVDTEPLCGGRGYRSVI